MSTTTVPPNPIIFYDGVCGLCNRLVQFTLKHDADGRLRFASLQSGFAAAVLQRHGFNSRDLDTLYVVEYNGLPEERISLRSDAAIAVLRQLGDLGQWLRLSSSCPQMVAELGLQDNCAQPLPHLWPERHVFAARRQISRQISRLVTHFAA